MGLTLIGKFSGPRPNIDVVRVFASRRWKLKGHVDISALPRGFFSFVFSYVEDILVILCGGPWAMGRSSLILKKWAPNLDISDAFFEIVFVWVKLLGLPLEYWHEDIFKGIAGVFGELLFIDPMTTSRKIMVYARIFMGLSRSKDLPSLVDLISKLGSVCQVIEYESLPFVCFLCKKARHWVKRCPQNNKIEENGIKGPRVWKYKQVLNGDQGSKDNDKPERPNEVHVDSNAREDNKLPSNTIEAQRDSNVRGDAHHSEHTKGTEEKGREENDTENIQEV
ncbi:uncharacterized protein LOC131050928 [Cryptomeria japonica]|uniref:uncharacterized protein LOC131050928 n=1 Tax=Cryptomeria japonica TaxID=3369 RepID=UPI0027DA19A7|nr:uncharacterized protein LOC131050928 [Cryptomeria japonica]